MESKQAVQTPIALVVDDDPFMRLLARDALEQAGLRVEEAADGAAGLAAIRELRPDIVLLDVAMPILDGLAVCRALRKLPGGRHIPVLMLTGLDDTSSIDQAYEAGATDFITKPVNASILGHRVKYILSASKSLRELRLSKDRLREVLAHQDRVKEEERTRIAREIHDELGGLLTGIKSYLSFAIDGAERAGSLPDRHMVETCELADLAIDTVRRVISDLRPSVLDQLGLWAALEWYASQIEERTGLACRVTIDASAASRQIDAEQSTALFRIVQETLTNVVRHAKATCVTIDADCHGGSVVITLKDDGKGIEAMRLLNRESWGIAGMYERARYLGGELKITGAEGEGTIVVVRVPLEDSTGAGR